MVALEAMVTGEDVGREVCTRQVADVHVTVGVGPGDRDVDIFRHIVHSLLAETAAYDAVSGRNSNKKPPAREAVG